MAATRSPAERLAKRARLFASAQARHAHGRAFSVTPRDEFAILPTSVTPPHELEAARARPVRGEPPHPDGHHHPAEEN